MQRVEKKQRRGHRHARTIALVTLMVALLGGGGAYWALNRPVETPEIPDAVTYGELMVHDADEVARLSVTLRSGEQWAVTQQADGTLLLDGATDWVVGERTADSLLNAAAVVSYNDVLTDDPAEYRGELAAFGLDTPRVVAEITYADGQSVTLRIGDMAASDETYSYMTVDGDDRLFALDKGTADALNVEQTLLHPVTQPVIHKARIDEITLQGEDNAVLAAWSLKGSITDSDASMRWWLTAPWSYPADGEQLANLRTNLSNFRLGAYVGEAVPENVTACGLDTPRFTLTVHQAAGTTGEAGEDGGISTTDWLESTLVVTVGGAKNDNVDYVQVGDSIYLCSHFSLNVFMSLSPIDTLSRYPVMVALSQLQSLTVTDASGETTYVIRREEQVAENNALVTDNDGNVVYDSFCARNGEDISWDAFSAAYDRLLLVTVSGRLPEGWQVTAPPHTTFTFVTDTGLTHTVALAKFDALHDAVLLDGEALFYLIDGGMTLSLTT